MARPNRGPHLRFIERRGVYYIIWYELGCERMRSTGTADQKEAEKALLEYRGDGKLPDVNARREAQQFIYFVGGDVGAIKIGLAIDPKKRLQSLQCGSPIPLSILATTPGDKKLEYLYHLRLREHRLHGEWFDRHPNVLAEIERLAA
jgi:hypothetical protein